MTGFSIVVGRSNQQDHIAERVAYCVPKLVLGSLGFLGSLEQLRSYSFQAIRFMPEVFVIPQHRFNRRGTLYIPSVQIV